MDSGDSSDDFNSNLKIETNVSEYGGGESSFVSNDDDLDDLDVPRSQALKEINKQDV